MKCIAHKVAGTMVPAIAIIFFLSCRQEENTDRDKPAQSIEAQAGPENRIPEPIDQEIMAEGEAVYGQYCLVCHQAGGGGVTGLNPPLRETEYVLGPKERLVNIILKGSNEGLLVNGKTYSNAMPGFPMLSDNQVASLATYIRNSFGNRASVVEVSEVAATRAATSN